MHYELAGENKYVVRILKGEEALEALSRLCEQADIRGGFFYGIGATDFVELAHYSVEDQKYSTKTFTQPLEVTGITGSIAYKNDAPIIHAHGTFSTPEMDVRGGHIVKLKVSATLEILITATTSLIKEHDAETGLNLLQLDHQI
jgi:uncharacterized protein